LIEAGAVSSRALFEFLGVKLKEETRGGIKNLKLIECREIGSGPASDDIRVNDISTQCRFLEISTDIGKNAEFICKCLHGFNKATAHLTTNSGHKYIPREDYAKVANLLVEYLWKCIYQPTDVPMTCGFLGITFKGDSN
jgi:hypothetical protein